MLKPTLPPPTQARYEIRLLHDQKVPMRDGVRLSADLFLPRAEGPFPTLLHRTPYERNHERHLKWAIYMARRGYAVVQQDCRGRFKSEGEFYPYVHDGPDGYDTLEWIAKQPWCNGKIGTWGRSYGGIFQWQLAPMRSPHLTCMAPQVAPVDYFTDYHYIGGAFQLALSILFGIVSTTNQATVREASADLFSNRRYWRQLPLIHSDIEAIGQEIPAWRDWLAHATNDEYWQATSLLDKVGQVDVPVYSQGGWYDPYTESIFRSYNGVRVHGASERARKNQKVMIGPWTHRVDQLPEGTKLGDVDFGPNSYMNLWDEDLRWFDYWLKGVQNGIMNEPPIKIFVMGINEWRFEHEWPLARTQFTPYYLHSGGRANSLTGDGSLSLERPAEEPADQYDYDPDNPVPALGGNNSTQTLMEKGEDPILPGPVDQRPVERRDDVLVYTSAPLESDLEITGPISMTLYAASSARDTDFTAKLVNVHPNGFAMHVAEGIIRARYRKGWDRQVLLDPGVVEEYQIELASTSLILFKGHRIRVEVSSSLFPRFSRNLNTGEDVATGTRMEIAHQTVFHDSRYPSHILLPLVPSTSESSD